MEILFWLLPAALTTGAAMLYVSWIGRERSEREPTAADQERFAAAIMKPLPKRDLQRDPRRAPKGSTEGTTASGTAGNSATRRAS